MDPQPTPSPVTTGSNSGPSGSGAILSTVFNQMQRDTVFWTATAIAVFVSVAQGAITTLTEICEAEGLWTVRFRLGIYEHLWWTGIAVTLVASLGAMIVSFLAGNSGEALGILALSTASSIAVFRYAWPAWRNRHYCHIRWLAWTGPSRTGIDGTLVPYIGGPQEWRELNSKVNVTRMHPVETRPTWLFRSMVTLIAADPTDLLKAAHALKLSPTNILSEATEKFQAHSSTIGGGTAQTPPGSDMSSQPAPLSIPPPSSLTLGLSSVSPSFPSIPASPSVNIRPPFLSRSSTTLFSSPISSYSASLFPPKEYLPDNTNIPAGLYTPIVSGKSASLLWGFHLGFDRRVSRGILSMPQRLLTSHPRTEADHDGRPICLAHGILARNKGLAPWTFILNLDLKEFEEKSIQWPRPAKVLRSYYDKEMRSMYGTLGDAFVQTATELALLLADSHHSLVSDWLEASLEHQDLGLNRQAHELGASPGDLQLLYRLSYAAMLASLSSHVQGHHLRPEMTLFKTYVERVEGKSLPAWTKDDKIQARLAAEKRGLTTDLDPLIKAVLPPYIN